MAINKKLIHFKSKENFEKEVANENILDTSICFILDSKEISTHGTVYKTVNWSILEYPSINIKLTTLGEPNLFTSYFNPDKTIGTFSAPYATIIPEGVTAYYSTTPFLGESVLLIPIEKGLSLPANLGVLLVGEPGVNNVVFHPAYNSIKLADLSLNTILNSAQGPVTMVEGDHVLSKGSEGIGIYAAAPGIKLRAGKAYFHNINY